MHCLTVPDAILQSQQRDNSYTIRNRDVSQRRASSQLTPLLLRLLSLAPALSKLVPLRVSHREADERVVGQLRWAIELKVGLPVAAEENASVSATSGGTVPEQL